MLLLKIYSLVLTIPLASLKLSTIFPSGRTTFLIFIFTIIFYEISNIELLGGLCQTTFINQDINIQLFSIFVPIKIYNNAESDKSQILTDLKGLSGIYMFTHKESGKFYVGSAFNLSLRLKNYFNQSYLEDSKDNSYIYNALLHHGYSSFSLSILEFIDISNLSKKDARKLILLIEQKYLNLIFKEAKQINSYNLLPTADSRLGALHSKETKALISKAMIETMTDERKALISKGMTGELNPMFGKNHSVETLEKMKDKNISEYTKNLHRINRTGITVSKDTRSKMKTSYGGVTIICTNIENGEEIIYLTKSAAALALECSIRTISRRCEDNIIYKFKDKSYKLSYKNK
jgi:group I intron endonuclease